ncbi:MAG: head GIN domain-containing protein [Bacteroidota bacterium]
MNKPARKNNLKVLMLALSACFLSACFTFSSSSEEEEANISMDGPIVSTAFDVDPFTRVKIGGAFEVELVQGSEASCEIDAPQELLDKLKVVVEDGVLHIRSEKKFNFQSREGIKVKIVAKEFESFEIGGAASVNSNGTLSGNEMDFDIKGAGAVDLEVEVSDLEVEISGASQMTLAGSADDASIEINGAGNLEAYTLEVENLDLSLAGAGSARVYASEKLDVKLSGVGSVKYKGKPSEVNKKVSGLGSISEG